MGNEVTAAELHAHDPAAMEELMDTIFPGVALRPLPMFRDFVLRTAVMPGVSSVGYSIDWAGQGELASPEQVLAFSLRGAGRLRHAGQELPVTGAVLFDDASPVNVQWDQLHADGFSVDRAYVRSVAAVLAGRDQPSHLFTAGTPVDDAHGRLWEDTARFVGTLMREHSATLDSPILQRSLLHHLALTLLHSFPNIVLADLPTVPAPRGVPVAVRRATAFIDEHAHEPITVDDVARAVGLSTRGLQVAFRRHLDVTPRERLRQARLDGAHRDLVYADPHTTTVASVARRWGFVHLGHFATAYRAAYGERPAQTLAR
ncbi:helix-turn-helix transcriptional regulator [Promicromonospora sp. NPDC059942]|uniref:helix-turn-helix transcriptional regulator n=1 Tax=Promicromonospora sp. NPDC059942 TaxID=3347009 RepID=UPI00365323A6